MEILDMKIIIACGGTGGHLFPGVAVAQELKSRGYEVKLLISQKKVDARASEKYKNLDFDTVPAVAKPRTLSLQMIPFMWKMWKTIGQCKRMHKEFGTDAVIGMGGFTSLAPVLAGHKLGAKAYVHDSNALPGKANRLTSRWCDKVFVGFEAARKYFPNNEVVLTGTPVRDEIRNLPSRVEAAQKLGLDPDLQTVLVMGGSQGARHVNDLIVGASKAMPAVQFLQITGNGDYERVKEELGETKNHKLLAFCDDMAAAYAVSDLAVMRSGASSLTELSYLGRASILIPYPTAADDHQTLNAEVFEKVGAALLRKESDIDAGSLVADLTAILEDAERLESMAAAAEGISVKDAAERICKAVENK